MKKISLLLLTLFISFFAFSMDIKIKASVVGGSDFSVSSGATLVNAKDGGICFVEGLSHSKMVNLNFNVALNQENDAYLNLKGYVDNIYRIKMFYTIEGASSTQIISKIFDTTAVESGETTLNDGYFELHYELPNAFFEANLKQLSFQVYMDAKYAGLGEMQLLGVAFDSDGTYNTFSEKQVKGVEEVGDIEITSSWVCGSNINVIETFENGKGKVTFTNAQSSGVDTLTENETITIPVNNFLVSEGYTHVSMLFKADGINEIGLHVNYIDGSDESGHSFVAGGIFSGTGWNSSIKNKKDEYISSSKIDSYIASYKEIESLILTIDCDASATFEIEEIQITKNANHTLVFTDNELALSDIKGNAIVNVSKDPLTEVQTLTYDSAPGWNTCSIDVTNYNKATPLFYINLTLSSDTQLCFSFNGNYDFALGHHTYEAGNNIIKLDTSSYDLPKNFVLQIYTDANVSPIEELKTIEVSAYYFLPLSYLEGTTVTLGGEISLNFYMILEDVLVNDMNTFMRFTLPNEEIVDVNISEARQEVMESMTFYAFTIKLNAKQMSDNIIGKIISTHYESTEFSQSIKSYAESIISEPSYGIEAIALAKALLNYGASAQMKFDYNIENLANSSLSNVDKVLNDIDAVDFSSNNIVVNSTLSTLTYVGSSVLLDSNTIIRHYFTLDALENIEEYEFRLGEEVLECHQKESMYYVDIKDILANDLNSMFRLTITKNEESMTIDYSVYTYIDAINRKAEYTNFDKDVVKAMYYYCEASIAYINSLE